MIEPLIGADAWVARWVCGQIPPYDPDRGFGNCRAIGWVDGGDLVAGTVFHNHEPSAGVIELTSASVTPRWLTRPVINTMFGYVFDRCGCQMALMRVSDRNARMCSIARRFGFADALIRRLYSADEDGHVFTLTREEWLAHPMRMADGKTRHTDTA